MSETGKEPEVNDAENYAKELASLIRPFIESAIELRGQVKVNLNSKNELNWLNVEKTFYKFEDELNRFLGADCQ